MLTIGDFNSFWGFWDTLCRVSPKRDVILGLQSISRDAADNVSHASRLDPTMELITYSFVPPTL